MTAPLVPPPLTDGLVRLRPWQPADAPAIARIAADPDVPRFTYLPEGMTVEQATAWIAGVSRAAEAGEGVALAVTDPGDGTVLGNVGLARVDRRDATAELFWWLDAAARGRGVATAALRLACGWAFGDLGVGRLTARVDPGNVRSLRLAARVGLRLEGRLRGAEPTADGRGRRDLLLLARLADDEVVGAAAGASAGAADAGTRGTGAGASRGPGAAAGMEPRVSLITLGVSDVDRARGFYEALGWRGQQTDGTVFFQAGPLVLALWSREALAADARVQDPGGFGGIALAHNVRTSEDVDALLALAASAGGTVTRAGSPQPWGGYTGCFTDPDGHVWEVAHNPGFPLTVDGAVVLPDLGAG
jgi:uncharacterized protein